LFWAKELLCGSLFLCFTKQIVSHFFCDIRLFLLFKRLLTIFISLVLAIVLSIIVTSLWAVPSQDFLSNIGSSYLLTQITWYSWMRQSIRLHCSSMSSTCSHCVVFEIFWPWSCSPIIRILRIIESIVNSLLSFINNCSTSMIFWNIWFNF